MKTKINMITFLKRLGVLLAATALLAIVGVGCNTAHGFGKDVSSTGAAIEKGTK